MEAAVQGKAAAGNVELLVLFVTSPKQAFAALETRPRIWFPLLLTLLGTAGLLFWYYATVDVAWLADQMLSAGPQTAQMSEADRERAAARMTRPVLLWSSVIAVTLFVLVARVAEAAYYLLAGNLTGVQRTFRQWFAFSWWTGMPHLIGAIPAALILLLSSTNQIHTGEINPLSLNELFFHRGLGEPGFDLWSNLSLLHPVAWLLTVVGVQVWSRRSWTFSAIFAVLPLLVVYGAWAAFSFTRG
jgi:hypothetical protein